MYLIGIVFKTIDKITELFKLVFTVEETGKLCANPYFLTT